MKYKLQASPSLDREQETVTASRASTFAQEMKYGSRRSRILLNSSFLRLRSGHAFWAICGSLVLAVVYARAALLNLTYGIIGGDWDGYENAWNYYWVKTALFDLHRNPFFTDYIYYPTGISLRFHTLNPFNAFLTIPFNLTLGYVPTVNLLFVFSLFLTTFFTFLLIRYLVGNSWAAFAGAAISTYANANTIFFLVHGQANLIAAEWMPLYFFLLLNALHGQPNWNTTHAGNVESDTHAGKQSYRWLLYGAFSVLTLLIMSLTDWQYVVFAVFVTLFYFAFILFTRRTWRAKGVIFARLTAIGGTYAVIALPILVLPMIKEVTANPWLIVSGQSSSLSIDLMDLIGPGLGNPGYPAIAVAIIGLWTTRGRKEWEVTLFWMLIALLFYVLALGPVLQISGHATNIRLPYQWLQDAPGLSTSRNPRRYTIVASLGVGILVAFGIRALLNWFYRLRAHAQTQASTRSKKKFLNLLIQHRLVAPGIIAAFLVVSLSGFVYAAGVEVVADPPDWPKFYDQIAKDKDTYAILELPLFTEPSQGKDLQDHYMMYQIVHHKVRFGGRWSRDHKLDNPNNFVKKASLFRDLLQLDYPKEQRDFFHPERDFLSRTDYRTQGASILSYYNVRYVILYKEAISQQDWPRFVSVIEEVLGTGKKPKYEDRIMRVYDVPPTPAPPNPLTLDVGDGWFEAGVSDVGHVYRWADSADGQQSELYTMNLRTQPLRAHLDFWAYTYKQARTLKIAINGYEAGVIRLKPEEGEKLFSIELTIPPGNNVISFSSPEPPLPTGNPRDARLLTFGTFGVELKLK